ncbi:hypothetical protein Tco_0002912 [Tanacetum coccineum]
MSDHNKGNTSSEVEPNILPPIQSLGDFEFLMEKSKDDLKDLSNEELFEAEDEIDTDLNMLEEPLKEVRGIFTKPKRSP